MWQKSLDLNLADEETRPFTTSIWQYYHSGKLICTIGVMRPALMGNPYLWITINSKPPASVLKQMNDMADALHEFSYSDTMFAEVANDQPVHIKFVKSCGFKPFLEEAGRILYKREL